MKYYNFDLSTTEVRREIISSSRFVFILNIFICKRSRSKIGGNLRSSPVLQNDFSNIMVNNLAIFRFFYINLCI